MNKRGVSNVVISVLVILISIVAVGIIWVAIVPLLQDSGEGVTASCFKNDMYIKSCTYDDNFVSILVARGGANGEVSGVRFVFDQQGDKTTLDSNVSAPVPFESKRYVFAKSDVPIPSYVQIISVLPGGKMCLPSNIQVSCGSGALNFGPQCSDNADNDGDSLVDLNDPGCSDVNDNDEQDYPDDGGVWLKLNGGNPIDGGESFTPIGWVASSNHVTTVKDLNGNLFYTFLGENSDYLYFGRVNRSKSWDVLTFSGWSRDGTKILKPLSQNRFLISKIDLFNWPSQNKIIGTFAAAPATSNNRLDIHDRAYSLSFDEQNSAYWTSDQGYNNNVVTPLSSTIFGTQGYSHDSDKNDNIILSISTAFHGARWLTAARYKNGVWENWKNNAWAQPTNFIYSENNLNILALPNSRVGIEDNIPVVTSIPGTQEFIVTYRSKDIQTSLISLKAMKYDDSSNTWFWWNNGWQNNPLINPQPLATGFDSSDSDRTIGGSFIQNDILYNLYLKYGSGTRTLYYLPYNLTSQVWGVETAMLPANQFAIGKNESGAMWLAYADQSNIVLSQFSEGILFNPENVLPVAGTRTLMGLDFIDSHPIIFVSEGSSNGMRLYALGKSEYWTNEQVRIPKTPVSPSLLDNHGIEKGQFGTSVWENISYAGNQYFFDSSYGSQLCGHMTFDSENNIYCPKVLVNGLGIFPGNYSEGYTLQNETAHHWGGWWDYLYFPSGVAVDNIRGKVYITDNIAEGSETDANITGKLQVWEKSWNDENVIRDIDTGNGIVVINPLLWTPAVYTQAELGHNLNWPSGITINEQRALLYLTETNFNRVVVYNISTGAPVFLKSFGSEGKNPGQFDHPEGIDTDSSGNVYVVDGRNNRIQKFDYDGNFITLWGQDGRNEGQFIYPHAISIDKTKDYVYVTDPGNHRLQIFHLNGSFVYLFGEWTPQNPASLEARIFNKMGGIAVRNNTLYASVSGSVDYPKIAKFQMSLP